MADEEELSTILLGNTKFSKRLTRKLLTTDQNTFISSISIYSTLTLLSQDPWFYNKRAFNDVLFIPDVNVAAERYKDILALLNAGRDVSVASTAFLKYNHELLELFKARITDKFVYDINFINFNRSEDAAQIINDWVEDKTSERLKMDPDSVDDGSRLTLLNAIHFSGKWRQPFETNNTVPAPFYLTNNETIEVQMMKTRGEFYYKYDQETDTKVLELPFVNSNISLVVLLPSAKSNYGYWLSYLNHDLTEFIEDTVKQEVDVSLPKFIIEESIELKQNLCDLGLADPFNANFFEVVKDEEVNLSKLQQKAFISVNEEGSEMAAVTMSNLNAFREEEDSSKGGMIYEMNMNTHISNRYATTKVIWKLKNIEKRANMANIKVTLADTAFITGFVMKIEEKSYKSFIKEKEEAKDIYNEALTRGWSAGLVESTARDSKEFTVSVNIEPEVAAVFTLTYEEMLVRVHDQYEFVLNICPGQTIQNLNVEVHITESRPLRFVKTPPLRTGNDTGTKNESFLDPSSGISIQKKNSESAIVKFHPDIISQRKFAHYLDGVVANGMSGQFVLQYDVERDPQDGEVLLQDGYFVHFLAPNDLDPIPKHVLFVLDTSGSMDGTKISQLKDAMTSILGEIRRNDMINIIEFNTEVIVWDINTKTHTILPRNSNVDFLEPFPQLSELYLPDPSKATETVISNAKIVVEKMDADGGTFIIGALQTALYMVKIGQEKIADKSENCQPIIVFLTDGEPNIGLHSTEDIVKVVTSNNKSIKVPIFSLSFGHGADKYFLRKLSLKNRGFSRHIYEGSDASLQLQEFYKQISSPLLSDIKFKYDCEVEEVTRTYFPIYFGGSELVVCGKYGLPFSTSVHCCGPIGPVFIRSAIETPPTSLERLWAYLTIKQLLEQRDSVEDTIELTRKAVALALKYSFVTDVTSLVVVKPTETYAVEPDYGPPEPQFRRGDISHYAPMSPLVNADGSVSVPEFQSAVRFRRGTISPPLVCADAGGYVRPQLVCAVPRGLPMPQCLSMLQSQSAYRDLSGKRGVCFKSDPSPRQTCAGKDGSSSGRQLKRRALLSGGGGELGPGQVRADSFFDDFLENSTSESEREPVDVKKKKTEEFLADRPFHIFLQYKKDNKVIILFQGRVYKPRC